MKNKIGNPGSMLLALVILLVSCGKTYIGEGEVVDVTREVGNFNGIALNMDAIVYVTDTMTHSCVVKAQKNLQEAIITRMDGNILVITSKGTVISDEPIVIEIGMNRAHMFEINGSGQILSTNTFKNEKTDFEVNGSGVIKMDVVANKVTCAVTGSGNLDLSGSTNTFDVEVNGSGTVNAYSLASLISKAKLNGSGMAFLNVGESLKAEVSGSGEIKYKGEPKLDQDITGSGTVERVK